MADLRRQPESPLKPEIGQKLHEHGVVWTLWFTYGAFYFCRTNISATTAALATSPGLGLEPVHVGWILASLKLSYALGQLINGQLAERIRPRVLLAIGMFGSAALNVLFGLGTGFYFLLFVWACNGYCQSLGWTPTVRVVGNWIPASRRGKAIGIIGTGYQVTIGVTYVVASFSAEHFGWRGAMFVPAGLLALAGIAMLVLLREMPDDAAENPTVASELRGEPGSRNSLAENVFLTLFHPSLWILGLALSLLNACRYGFMDWGLAHLLEVQESSISNAGLKYCVIAIGAVAGSFCAGWATDRFFAGRRAPVIVSLLVLLAGLTLLYESVSRSSATGTVLLLVVIGFCIYGPQVLLVGTAPADLAHKGTAAAAAGFVNFMGYMGAATGDVVTGYFSDEAHGGWQVAIYIWAGWALGAAMMTMLLWNATTSRMKLLPRWLPGWGGAALVLAGTVLLYQADGPTWILVTSALAALGLVVASVAVRQLALLVAPLALVGAVCLSVGWGVQLAHDAAGWYRLVPTVAHGLAVLASVMVLVDQR